MKQLLAEARHEILDLRRRNEILSAQMAIVEVFAAVVGLKQQGQAMAVDVAWSLQKKIDELNESGS